jgi:hypothetical protein
MPIQPPLSSSEAAPALKLAQDMGTHRSGWRVPPS